jgi:hypothetical protein
LARRAVTNADTHSAVKALSPVSFRNVQLDDVFWAPRMDVNRRVTIPLEFQHCRDTNRLRAFDPRWRVGDKTARHRFWDSDVAKLLEAAAYVVAATQDTRIRRVLDDAVRRVVGAQQPDGYLNSYYTFAEPDQRFKNLRDNHELYCAGHLIEAAVAHYEATGSRVFLDAMCRYADYIDRTFGRGKGQKRGYCGHQEIELALIKLYRATGQRRYLRLAAYFLEERGRKPHYYDQEALARGDDPKKWYFKTYEYLQAHVPIQQQTDAVGHAVRCLYMLAAAADLALETGDARWRATAERLWRSICHRRMVVTGGAGTDPRNEGFSFDYDLPDESAYAETCAAIANVFFNHRMLQLTADSSYADVIERALYNGVLSGISLDGTLFFYSNPLAAHDSAPRANRTADTTTWDGLTTHRKGWFGCACCPPNIARLIASVGEYFYATDAAGIYVHLYGAGTATITRGDGAVTLTQRTKYPWNGRIQLTVTPDRPRRFTLFLRIPDWCDDATLSVAGRQVHLGREVRIVRGYAAITREWRRGDAVVLELAMPVKRVYAHPAARQLAGRVALQRGPIVYCLETVDNVTNTLDQIAVPRGAALRAVFKPKLLGGVVVIEGRGQRVVEDRGPLYRGSPPALKPVRFTAVPYCVWDNRRPGSMRVWLREV